MESENKNNSEESRDPQLLGEIMPGVMDEIHRRHENGAVLQARADLIDARNNDADPEVIAHLMQQVIDAEAATRDTPRPGEEPS